MPGEEPFFGQRLLISLCRIEHHLNDTLDIAVGSRQSADIDSQTARNGGAHLIPVENLAFNLTRLQDIFRQGLQNSFGPELKAERFHASDEASLPMTHNGQAFRQAFLFPAKPGPIRQIVDIVFYSPHHVRTI